MSEPTKEQLVDQAEELGVPEPEKLTKPKLEDAIEARSTPRVGAPASGQEFEKRGSVTGVQPLTADEIPESGR